MAAGAVLVLMGFVCARCLHACLDCRVRALMQAPRRKDVFELVLEEKLRWDSSAPDAHAASTATKTVEAQWRQDHYTLGNLSKA